MTVPSGRNERDLPRCGLAAMGHNAFGVRWNHVATGDTSSEQEMSILGIDIAKHVLHAVGMDRGKWLRVLPISLMYWSVRR